MAARDNILSKIKNALKKPVEKPFPEVSAGDLSEVFTRPINDTDVLFAENFTKVQGNFVYCTSETDFVKKLIALMETEGWKKIYCRESTLINMLQKKNFHDLSFSNLSEAEAALTSCDALVARTGSLLLSSGLQSGRTTSFYTPVHLCVAYTSQVVYDIADALNLIKEKYEELPSMITFASGPSRTADIEKTLVVGIHGPKQVFCFLIEE